MNDLRRLLGALAVVALACEFLAQNGMAAAPETQQRVTPPRVGQAVYQQHCAACHGANGQGNGPAAVWLYPKPRHFDSGLFKIRSTPSSFLPTDEDLFQTITRGMPGSS